MSRKKWILHDGKLVPENEYRQIQAENVSGRTLNFSIFKSGFNPSLGAYCGSQKDVNAACTKIEDSTGSRPVEIGNEKIKYAPKLKSYDLGRGFMEKY